MSCEPESDMIQLRCEQDHSGCCAEQTEAKQEQKQGDVLRGYDNNLVRDGLASNQDSSSKGGKKWSHSGCAVSFCYDATNGIKKEPKSRKMQAHLLGVQSLISNESKELVNWGPHTNHQLH